MKIRTLYEETRYLPMPRGSANIETTVALHHVAELELAIIRVTLTQRAGSGYRCAEIAEILGDTNVLAEDQLIRVETASDAIRRAIDAFDRRVAKLELDVVRAYDNSKRRREDG